MISDIKRAFAKIMAEQIKINQDGMDRAVMANEQHRAAMCLGKRIAFLEAVEHLNEAIRQMDVEDDEADDDEEDAKPKKGGHHG